MKVLILGANGMLGHSLYTNLPKYGHEVFGTIRSSNSNIFCNKENIHTNIDFKESNFDSLEEIIDFIKPGYIINCVGVIKQKNNSNDLDQELKYINSSLPKILSNIAEMREIKFIHFSTDCVFNGELGNYTEKSISDAHDMYGKTKYEGEALNKSALTLRTSIIGHELNSSVSLLEWFLSQDGGAVEGYSNAIFSGLPTCYVAEVLSKFIFGNDLTGIFHLSVDPIDKFTLLTKIATIYNKNISITKNSKFKIDRSLSSAKLKKETGYNYYNWDKLILMMYEDRITNKIYENRKD